MNKGLSPRAQKLLSVSAQGIAKKRGSGQLTPEHVLLGMISDADSLGFEILLYLNINILMLQLALEQAVPQGNALAPNQEAAPSRRLRTLIDIAAVESRIARKDYIGTEHLLLATLREENSVAARFFSAIPVTVDAVRQAADAVSIRFRSSATAQAKEKEYAGGIRGQNQSPKDSLLAEYSKDLTLQAREGELDPVVGRETEISRVIQILSRRSKNNPVLVGEPGVGKTAIVEGLALKIAEESVPKDLLNKRILVLDLASVIAGTKYRGEFEERIKKIIKEITDQKDIIIFIDELHTLIGAGGAEGSMDASNMLKPALSRGLLQVIGATTQKEYRKYFEKDSALERRFQQVSIVEPSDEETVKILKGILPKYEEYHHVKYAEGVVEQIVKFSRRYITERFLPDKAIDLLDEAGAMKKIQEDKTPTELTDLEKQISLLQEEKQLCIQNQNFEQAASTRDKIKSLREKQEKFLQNGKITYEKNLVTEKDICTVVSEMTGIPANQLDTEETKRLINMEKELHKTVIGQEEAVSLISSAVRRARAGVSSFNRPQGSFIFLGPTGVGKTLLAKTLAKFLFGTEEALIRIDMSDFMEKHTASRLVGAPPGYVGYEEGGVLTEKVRRNPYSVVLLDEVEKAHADIFNLLLQVLEEGELKDNLGHTVNFKNTVIIMTSNAGAREITTENRLGFSSSSKGLLPYEQIKDNALTELKKFLRPELLNRIDDVVVFNPLSEEEVNAILESQIKDLEKRLMEKGLKIKLKPSGKKYFAEKGYEPAFGARPMRRLIQREIEDSIANLILSGEATTGDTILVEAKNQKSVVTVKKAEDKPKKN